MRYGYQAAGINGAGGKEEQMGQASRGTADAAGSGATTAR
jgi:hypothetical protein